MSERWGSDLVAEGIQGLGFGFAVYNPGASWRGLHDSLVNHLDGGVELVLALHEEHAVAVAHGWTKVTGRPALALVHSNVGLLHATMAIYNAWVDRAPVVVIGATGVMDAHRRRPWIEWIHTFQDQAQLVRPYTKWDDQPASAEAAVGSLAHGVALARLAPQGPVYICLDVADQETRLPASVTLESVLPEGVPSLPQAAEADLEALATALAAARRPLLLVGRTTRSPDAWAERIALAERTGACVVTDIRTAAGFPTDHPAHLGGTGFGFDAAQLSALRESDLIVALDWIDPATALAKAAERPSEPPAAFVVTLDHLAHRGWTKDGFALPPYGRWLAGTPEDVVSRLLTRLAPAIRPGWTPRADAETGGAPSGEIPSLGAEAAYGALAGAIEELRSSRDLALTRLPLGWPAGALAFRDPLDYLGRDGGEGLASGPGMAVGIALALKGTGRLPVAVLGDGDLLMGLTALWTAASRKAPLLVIVAANGVYGNDVVHQERIARERGRPVGNKWVGQTFTEPRPDFTRLSTGQGAVFAARTDAFAADLGVVLREAAEAAVGGEGVALVEVAIPAGV
jgi:acetolactate synthase I/II/III large subunit